MRSAVLLAAAAALCISVGASAAPLSTDSYTFNIGATHLEGSLQQLADVTGLILVYDRRETFGARTSEVKGEMSGEQALRRLLFGTGLEFRYDDFSGQVLIFPRQERFWLRRGR